MISMRFKSPWFLSFLLFSAVLLWLAYISLPDNKLHIYFMDVGQGDAIFIVTPANYQILIDGGPDPSVLTELSKIVPFYDKELDLVVLTHPHSDHLLGLIKVFQGYQVKKVLFNSIDYQSAQYKAFLQEVEKKKIPRSSFGAGDRISLSDGVELRGFWPQKQSSFFELWDVNTASIVMRLDFKNFSALFTGDAELGPEIPELESLDWTAVDVLKVPHQGSKGSITIESLTELRPALTVISVGENNFGHPDREVLELLESEDVNLMRTDLDGTIEVVTDGEVWWVRK